MQSKPSFLISLNQYVNNQMFIGHYSTEDWYELNEYLGLQWRLTERGGVVKVMPGVGAALFEVGIGLSQQFPLKKKILAVQGQDPTLSPFLMSLSRDGYSIQWIDEGQLGDVEFLKSCLTDDVLFVLVSEDDPLLGVCFNYETLKTEILKKKIYGLFVSHAAHRGQLFPNTFERFFIFIRETSSRTTVILHSQRLKWAIRFAETFTYSEMDRKQIVDFVSLSPVTSDLVTQFEANLPLDAKISLDSRWSRLRDRAVIYWPDMDGWSVIVELANRRKQMPETLLMNKFETTSLHRWRGLKSMDWLGHYGFDSAKIRGTLIIAHSEITPQLQQELTDIRKALHAIQFDGKQRLSIS